jgi:acyl carrier protein
MTETQVAQQDAQLRDRVREVLAAALQMDESELADDVSQETCGQWTSLYHMMLLVALEDQFGVTFSMDEMTSMTSLPRIVAVLKDHAIDA